MAGFFFSFLAERRTCKMKFDTKPKRYLLAWPPGLN